MHNTAPARQVIIELITDDVFAFGGEDMGHVTCGGVLDDFDEPTLEVVADALCDPDGWVEFGGATFKEADHDWDEDGEKYYSRSRIFARHVARLTVVYDEPARMDLGGE